MNRRAGALIVCSALAVAWAGACPVARIRVPDELDGGSFVTRADGDVSPGSAELPADGGWCRLYEGARPTGTSDWFGTWVTSPDSIRVLFSDRLGLSHVLIREVGLLDGGALDRIIWEDNGPSWPDVTYLRDGSVWIHWWSRGYPMPWTAFWVRGPNDTVEVTSCPNGAASFFGQSELVPDGQQLVVPYLCNADCPSVRYSLAIRLQNDGGIRKSCLWTATSPAGPPGYWVQSPGGTEIFTSNGTGMERQLLTDMRVSDGGRVLDVIESSGAVAYTGAATDTPVVAEIIEVQKRSLALIGMSVGADAGAFIKRIPGTDGVDLRSTYVRFRGKFLWTFYYVYDPVPRMGVLDPISADFSAVPLPLPEEAGPFGEQVEITSDGKELYQVVRINLPDGGFTVLARRMPEIDAIAPP